MEKQEILDVVNKSQLPAEVKEAVATILAVCGEAHVERNDTFYKFLVEDGVEISINTHIW